MNWWIWLLKSIICYNIGSRGSFTRSRSTTESHHGGPVGAGTISQITKPLVVQTSALHQETLSFLVLEQTEFEIILGLPWLEKHNPLISWSDHTITKWSDECLQTCIISPSLSVRSTSVESPDEEKAQIHIPPAYQDLKEVFNKVNATKLPPHRTYYCAIDLIENHTFPKARVYPLTQEEQKALDVYIQEALEQGFIRPSTSPITSSFVFIKMEVFGIVYIIEHSITFRIPILILFLWPLSSSTL